MKTIIARVLKWALNKVSNPEESTPLYPPQEFKGLHRGRILGATDETLIGTLIERYFPSSSVVALTDINVGAKSRQFWEAAPASLIEAVACERVIFFVCKDKSDATNLIGSVDRDFAKAYQFQNSVLVDENSEVW